MELAMFAKRTEAERDPDVVEASAQTQSALDENAQLIKELAAVERALVRGKWKKRQQTTT